MFKRTMTTVLKIVPIITLLTLLSACKLAVMVPSGGSVQSTSGTRDCDGPNFCEFEVASAPFSETFIAIPNPGYEFEKWSDGRDFQCPDSTDTSCTVSIPDSPIGRAIVALFDMAYVMPLFKDVGIDTDGDGVRNELDEDDDNDGIFDIDDACPLDPSPGCSSGTPITDTIVINGVEWAQVDLFVAVSWNEINAICPTGACSGLLRGYDMSGWTWATLDEVNTLFNEYIGSDVLGPGASSGNYLEAASSWAPQIFLDGMRPIYNFNSYRGFYGLSYNTVEGDSEFTWFTIITDWLANANLDTAGYVIGSKDSNSPITGAWFYRAP